MKAFAFSIFAVLLSAPIQAATVTVSSTTDTGAGSLRQAITDSNGLGGANTIGWSSGGSGTITLGSNLPNVNANTTFDFTASTNPVTIAGAPNALPLSGATTLNNGGGNTATISAVISDGAAAGSITKTGTGQVNLTGANTYTGGTTLNAGVLGLGTNASLGTGGATLNGGSLQLEANVGTVANALTLGANGTLDDNGFTGTFSGGIGDGGNGFSLTKIGGGTITLTGVSSYSGGTVFNGGILNANADAALGNAAGGLTFNGGAFQFGSAFTSARAVTLNDAGGVVDTNGFNSTLSGAIGGDGGLTKNGLGTLFLTGNNTFQGPTTINNGVLNVNSDAALGSENNAFTFSSGTLQLAADYVSTRTFSVSSFGQFDNNGHNLTLNGTIGGGGALQFTGAGNVTLTGSNGYYGGTSIQGGSFFTDTVSPFGSGGVAINAATSIQFAASSGVVLGNPFTLNANATFDTNGGSTTISGTISGTGAIIKTGAGVLQLAGGNTYSGGTTVNNGFLSISDDSSLGATTGGLTLLNGATVQAQGNNFSTSRAITLGAGGGVFDDYGRTIGLSGVIGGAGSFTKTGSGTVYLSAVNTYGGATAVTNGVLALGIDNALPAGTPVTIASGGTLDLGTFKQTTSQIASLEVPGTLAMTLQAAQNGTGVKSLAVTGNAKLTGGTLYVKLTPQVVKAGAVFTPLTYGSNTGTTFTTILSPAAIAFTPDYTSGTSLKLTASLVPFANVSASVNQAAIGRTLEPLRVNPAGDMATILGNLYTLDAGGLQAALDQMGPASLGAMSGISLAGSAAQGAALSRRMQTLADAGRADRPANYTVTGPSFPGTLYAEAAGDTPMAASGGGLGRWGYFASGVASGGKLTETNTAGGTNPGYAFNTQGLTGGADYRVNDNAALGASLGWLRGHSSIYSPGSGTVDSQSVRLGGYGTAFTQNLEADLYVGGALDYFSTHRNINFVQVSRTASGTPRGWELNVHPALRYDYNAFDYGIFSPFLAESYDRIAVQGFSESGAQALDLAVGPQTIESLEQDLGLRYSMKIDADTFNWIPYGSLGWRHEYQKQSRPITASFAEAGGAPFQIQSGDVARNGTIVGLGAAVNWTKYTTFKLDYSSDFRSHFQNTTVELSLRSRF